MIGNPVGAICKIKELNGREYEGRITSATMRQMTGCVPELDLSVAVDTVCAAEFVPPWGRKAYIEPPHIPQVIIRNAEQRGRLMAKQVIFNPPATVVLWADGTKTVVKCDPEDTYNKRTGLALCYMKKALGNKSRDLNKALKKAEGD